MLDILLFILATMVGFWLIVLGVLMALKRLSRNFKEVLCSDFLLRVSYWGPS